MITATAHYFLLCMSFGTIVFSPLVSPKLTGAGFQKLLWSVGFGLFLTSFILYLFLPLYKESPSFYLHFIIIGLMALRYKNQKDYNTGSSQLIWLFINIGFILLGVEFFPKTNTYLHFLFTSFLVGITNFAMILGHYYLVVPKLSEKPLLNSLQLLWFFMVLKFGQSLYGYQLAQDFFVEGSIQGGGYLFNWILLSMRFLWGYLALFVLSLFAWKLCRIRSIQSATGIFYVMVFFMIVGELISVFLLYEYGIIL